MSDLKDPRQLLKSQSVHRLHNPIWYDDHSEEDLNHPMGARTAGGLKFCRPDGGAKKQ
jgi:hypothetical protein